jgi:hypothetical protein
MTISLTSFETAMQAKLNSLDSTNDVEDFVLLTKAVNDVEIAMTNTYATVGSLPTASDHTGRIVYVTDTNKVYYSNGSDWVTFATSQNPDFTTALLAADTVADSDYASIADAVGSTEDYGAITGTSTDADDFGSDLEAASAGTQGDIYIDPNDWSFTIYDGSTRSGVKHLRADKNNVNFYSMSAANQGVAQIVKNTDSATSGALIPIKFNETRLNDTRMGYLDSNGYYHTNYEGWYEVRVDGIVDGPSFMGLGNIANYATEDGIGNQGPDPYTMMYLNQAGHFSMCRMVYCPLEGAITLFMSGENANDTATIYGTGSWITDNRNTTYQYFTQMNIRFLGDNTATSSYQVAAP